EVIAVERPFRVKIGKRVFEGVFDLVLRDIATNTIILHEHKTTRNEPESIARGLHFNPQVGGYMVALKKLVEQDPRLRELAPTIGQVCYNVLRRKIPTEPQVLKKGQVTSRADLDTTPEIYERALNEQLDRGITI